MVSFVLSTLDGSKNILLFAFKSHANLVINTSCILLYLSKALYIVCNDRLQELLLGELIQVLILWLVNMKLVIPSFANLTGYPPFKPTSSFVLTSLTYLPIT
jgi:hypothetical protein